MPSSSKQTDIGSGWGAVLIYMGVCLPVCFGWLGRSDVISMEGIVADGARYMDRTGDYLVPHLYGELYAYKPPLAYWLALGSMRVFGDLSEFTLRLPTALCGATMGLVILFLVGRVSGARAGVLSALATLTGVLMLQKIHLAEFDVPLAAGVAVAGAAACHNLARPRPALTVWLIGYLGLAFGVLAKGAPALLVYGVGLPAAAALTRRLRALLDWRHLCGVAVFVLLIGTYVGSVYATDGLRPFEQPWQEARDRATVWTLEQAGISVAKPLMIAAIFLPWSVLVPFTLHAGWRRGQDDATRRLAVAAWAFLIAGTLVFMAIPTHETRYYLPLCFAAGTLSGLAAGCEVADDSKWRRARDGIAGICAVVTGGLALAGGLQWALYATAATQRFILIAFGVAALAAVVVASRRASRVSAGGLLLISALCAWACLTFVIEPRRAERRSLRLAAATLHQALPADVNVWIDMGDDYSSLIFYLPNIAHTFRGCEQRPAGGSYVILFPRQVTAFREQCGVICDELARARHRDLEFVLCRLP